MSEDNVQYESEQGHVERPGADHWIPVCTVTILNGKHKGKVLVTTKHTWEEKIEDLQAQADESGIPVKIILNDQDRTNC